MREPLVARLKSDISDLDLEFMIPQLCQLLLTWPAEEAESLGEALVERAGPCVHLAIKLIWWLEVRSRNNKTKLLEAYIRSIRTKFKI